jgi:ABC-type spermidine/putrescine transport system permease subunit II
MQDHNQRKFVRSMVVAYLAIVLVSCFGVWLAFYYHTVRPHTMQVLLSSRRLLPGKMAAIEVVVCEETT